MIKNKKIIAFALLILVIIIWYALGVRECVVLRGESGIATDWATIKDCSY